MEKHERNIKKAHESSLRKVLNGVENSQPLPDGPSINSETLTNILSKKVVLINDHPAGTGIYSYTISLYKNLMEHGIRVKLYDYGNRGILLSLLLPRIMKLNAAGSIVHLSNPNLSFIASRVNSVITVHDLYYLHYESNSRIWSWYCRRNYKNLYNASLVIANSHSTENELKREMGIDKVKVVYPSIDKEFKEKGRKQIVWQGKKVLLHVGYDMPNKNIITILKALKMLPEEYVLVRVGKDSKRTLRAVKELGLESRYMHIRADGPEALASIYRGSHAMVFPSLYEGFGIPVVEAMACGLPVISSDRNGLKESASGGALIVDPLEPKAIADAVLSLEDHELYNKIRAAGIINASKFSQENQFKQLISAYSVEL
jgi:Glycosyltransferase